MPSFLSESSSRVFCTLYSFIQVLRAFLMTHELMSANINVNADGITDSISFFGVRPSQSSHHITGTNKRTMSAARPPVASDAATPGLPSISDSGFKKLFTDTPGSVQSGLQHTSRGPHRKVQTELLLDDIRAALNEKIDGASSLPSAPPLRASTAPVLLLLSFRLANQVALFYTRVPQPCWKTLRTNSTRVTFAARESRAPPFSSFSHSFFFAQKASFSFIFFGKSQKTRTTA